MIGFEPNSKMTLDMKSPLRLAIPPISESMRADYRSSGQESGAVEADRRSGSIAGCKPTAIRSVISSWNEVGTHRAWYVLRFVSTETVPLLRSLVNAKIDWHQFTFEKSAGRRKPVTRSWFPSYLFLNVDIVNDLWQRVYFMPGVIEVLGQPRPSAVSQAIMDYLHATLTTSLPQATAETSILPGTRIRARGGMFDGHEGVVQRSTRTSVDFVVMAFNRPVNVNMRIRDVEVVSDPD